MVPNFRGLASLPKFGGVSLSPKFTDRSGGMIHPSFKNRVKPIAMKTAYPGASKPIAFHNLSTKMAYR